MMSFILSIGTLSTLTYLFSSLYHYREERLRSLFYFLLSGVVLFILNLKTIHIEASAFVLLAYVYIQYNSKFIDTLKLTCMYYFFLFCAYIASKSFLQFVLSISFQQTYKEMTFILWLVLFVIFLLYLIYAYLYYKKISLILVLPSYTKYISIIPSICILFIPLLCSTNVPVFASSMGILTLLCIGLGSEMIALSSLQHLSKEHEKKLNIYMETSSQNKYNLLNQQYQNSFNLLHEIMHKCNELVLFMKNKEYAKVESELNTICDQTFQEFNNIYSNSVVFNTLLSNRNHFLQKHKIVVKTTITFNNFDFISFSNQVDLFNTLLDFILQEAKQSKTNKFVFIKSNVVANQVILSFRFANNHNHELERELQAALQNILQNYDAILSVNEIDEATTSLLLLFPRKA